MWFCICVTCIHALYSSVYFALHLTKWRQKTRRKAMRVGWLLVSCNDRHFILIQCLHIYFMIPNSDWLARLLAWWVSWLLWIKLFKKFQSIQYCIRWKHTRCNAVYTIKYMPVANHFCLLLLLLFSFFLIHMLRSISIPIQFRHQQHTISIENSTDEWKKNFQPKML